MAEQNNSDGTVLKFNVYDIFWYILPGIALLTGLCLYHLIFDTSFSEVMDENRIMVSFLNDSNALKTTGFVTCFVTTIFFFSYALGHFLSAFSSAIVDKLFVERMMGQPFLRLFNSVYTEDVPYVWYLRKSQMFYKSMILTAIPIMFFLVRHRMVEAFILISLFVLLLVSKIVFSIFSLEDIFDPSSVRAKGQRNHAELMLKYYEIILKPFMAVFLIIDIIFNFFRMKKPFERKFQQDFLSYFESTFKTKMHEMNTNAFWLPYWFVHQNSPKDFALIQYLQRQYSFLQNITIVFLLFFLYGIFCPLEIQSQHKTMYSIWCIVTGTGFLVFLIRYYYLYYNYYTKSVYRVFYNLACGSESQ